MNKTYRSVWNESTGTWVAASETANGRHKGSRKSTQIVSAALLAGGAILAHDACAGALDGGNTSGGINGAMAYGSSSYSSGTGSLAIGASGTFAAKTVSKANDTIAIGNGATAASNAGVAIGSSATVGYYAMAAGPTARALGDYSTAVGNLSTATGKSSVALGNGAKAAADNSVALGSGASAGAAVATASGVVNGTTYNFAGAKPVGVVSIGSAGAERELTNVAAGQVSAASTDAVNGSQLYATNTALNNIALKSANVVSYDGTTQDVVTLGGAKGTAIKNVAAGDVSASSTDAVNGAQLFGVQENVTNVNTDITKIKNTLTTAGYGAQAESANPGAYQMGGFITDGNGNVSNPAVLYVADTATSANPHIVLAAGEGDSGYFINGDRNAGFLPKGTVISNVADGIQDTDAANVGQVQQLIAEMAGNNPQPVRPQLKGVMMLGAAPAGSGVDASGTSNVYNTAAYYSQVRGVGNNAGSTAPTDVSRARGLGSIAIGSNTESDGVSSTAVGIQSLASANDSVALGSGSIANVANTVSVGSDGKSTRLVINPDNTTTTVQSQLNTRRVVNMAAGQNDTDAVNVAQLKGVTTALGGGSTVNADGSIQAPTYSVGGGTFSDVADALTAMNGQAASLSGLAVKYDSSAHAKVTLGGTGVSAPVALTNVANGALNAASTDAVNGAQLFQTNTNLTNLAGDVTNIAGDVSNLAGDVTNIGDKVANAVQYDSSAHAKVTLGGTGVSAPVALTNVANGALNAASTDAVNGAQLFQTNTNLTNLAGDVTNIAGDVSNLAGDVTNIGDKVANAVQYDSSAHDTLTLGGTGVSTPVTLTNVANGALNAASTDAVNGAQLFETNTNLTNLAGDVTNLNSKVADAVVYDSSAHDSVSLGGTGAVPPVALHNVAAGIAGTDAVNVGQLTSAGFDIDSKTGAVLNKAVTYDAGSIDSGTPTITLAPGQGDSLYYRNSDRNDGLLPKGTVISNVANGIQDTDAANVGQVWDIVSAQTNDDIAAPAQKMFKASLLGASNGSGVDPSGATKVYNTAAYYSQVRGVGNSTGSTPPTDVARSLGAGSVAIGSNTESDGSSSTAVGIQSRAMADDSVALGSGSIANVANTVSVGSDGTSARLVINPDNTTTTVQSQINTRRIVNMAAGQADTDAVNVAQLKGVTNALGGGVSVNADGSIASPQFDVAGGTYTNVAAALSAIDNKATPGNPNVVVYDSSAHDKLTLGTSGTAVALSNVANGSLNASSVDAVNGSQL
uniref:ESPR-type extended signal peptide-containing protein n=1 Tax=Paraburkholderia sp. J41 TaxID=2805433 RepID=UPI002AC33E9F